MFEFISLLNSADLQASIVWIKLFVIILGILMLASIIVFLKKTQWANFAYVLDATEFFTYRPYGLRRMTKKWEKIQGRVETGQEAEYKIAIIESEDILDAALKRMGMRGSDFGERIAGVTSAIVPNLQEVKDAHQTRDNIVHDPSYVLSAEQAKNILAVYEVAFRNLDLI
jgi:hypothetical protein